MQVVHLLGLIVIAFSFVVIGWSLAYHYYVYLPKVRASQRHSTARTAEDEIGPAAAWWEGLL